MQLADDADGLFSQQYLGALAGVEGRVLDRNVADVFQVQAF